MLTDAQLPILKAHILASPDLAPLSSGPGTDYAAIAAALNLAASPDFWGYRTAVQEREFTDDLSADGTSWSWPAYIARSVGEQNGWDRLFRSGPIDMSKSNVRQAFQDIFSGTQNNAPAQRTHCQAVARRKATRAERLYATGTGSTGSPGTFVVHGSITIEDVNKAMAS